MLSEFFKHILTAKDGESYDIGRVSWFVSTLAIFLVALYQLYHGLSIDIQNFGLALAANGVAHGASIGLKSNTEPT